MNKNTQADSQAYRKIITYTRPRSQQVIRQSQRGIASDGHQDLQQASAQYIHTLTSSRTHLNRIKSSHGRVRRNNIKHQNYIHIWTNGRENSFIPN